jgi:hypothetical protein
MRHKNNKYLAWIREQPCYHCGKQNQSEPHHIIGISGSGMGIKADDIHTMPLCRQCHDDVHECQNNFLHQQIRWLCKAQNKAQEEGML